MSKQRPFLRLINVTTLGMDDNIELRYRSRVKAWLVYWLLWLLVRSEWSLDVEHTHILDYVRNGRAAHFFPLDAKGYEQLVKLTKINEMEITHD